MASEIEQAIKHICEEKGLSYESVMETVETALAAAYRKDYGNRQQNIEIEFDPSSGGMKAFDVKEVVEDMTEEELEEMKQKQAELAAKREAEAEAAAQAKEEDAQEEGEGEEDQKDDKEDAQDAADDEEEVIELFNPKTQIMISDARVLKHGSEVGETIRIELPIPGDFGRMAAMTAKQVVTQKLREAEREIVFNEYKEQEGEVLIGTVQRREGRVVLVDIGRTTGVILPRDQVRNERYNSGDRVKVYVREVSLSNRGPQILLSRSSVELVRSLFELEVPEIAEGVVKIQDISREAGSRTKIAVSTDDESIDPIGACIGQRGIRIQTIIHELGGEKIDVIEWDEDPETFIINALAPAKVSAVELDEEEGVATVLVEPDQLSLAIGRGGQNVRLAAQLSGWKLNVRSTEDPEGEDAEGEEETSDASADAVASEDAEAEGEQKEEGDEQEKDQSEEVSDDEDSDNEVEAEEDEGSEEDEEDDDEVEEDESEEDEDEEE